MLTSQPDNRPQFECGRSIQEAVWQMQQSCQFTDLILACSDGTVPAHKAMMAGVFKMLGIVGQEEGMECFIIPGVAVAEVEQALEELYLKSEPAKLMNIFCCTNVKSENVLSLVEVKPEVASDEECSAADIMIEYDHDEGIKQSLSEFEGHTNTVFVTKPISKDIKKLIDPLNPLNAKNPHRPKHIERLRNLTCNECGYIAKNTKRLQKHKSFKHEILKFLCDYCDFKTAFRKDVESHRNDEHPGWKLLKKIKTLICDQCDFVAKRKETLAFHKRKEHGVRFPCDECDKIYLNLDKLEVHKNYAHDKTTYQCDQCPYQTNCKWSIKKHHGVKHSKELFYCDQCDFSSHTKNSLKNHVEAKHEGRRFYCEQCDYSAPYKGGLLRHIKMVHEGLTYQCDFCEHKATTRSNLKLHVDAKHLGIKYPCDLCDYQASQPGSLKIHKQTAH